MLVSLNQHIETDENLCMLVYVYSVCYASCNVFGLIYLLAIMFKLFVNAATESYIYHLFATIIRQIFAITHHHYMTFFVIGKYIFFFK